MREAAEPFQLNGGLRVLEGPLGRAVIKTSAVAPERHTIEATLDYTSGDKTRAARLLNIGRKTIYRKLEQYNGQQKASEPTDN